MNQFPSARPGFSARILVVEDSDDLRALMSLVLEAEGHVVDGAQTAEDGLQLLVARHYDLVLGDYDMPRCAPAWLLREAVRRRLLSPARGVLVADHPRFARDADGFAVIHKPGDLAAFVGQVQAYLERIHGSHREGRHDQLLEALPSCGGVARH